MGEWDLGATIAERSSVGEMAGVSVWTTNNEHPPNVRVNVT